MLSYFIYRNKTILSLIFCVLFSLVSLIWQGNGVSKVLVSMKSATSGVSTSLRDFGSWFTDIWNSLENYQKVVSERDLYYNNLKEKATLYDQFLKVQAENNRLRNELGFKVKTKWPTVKAEVLAVRLFSVYRTIVIDRGEDVGIEPFMPVVARAIISGDKSKNEKPYIVEALVGKIVSVDTDTAVVQPLNNSQFKCGVRIPGTYLWAILDGNSDRALEPILKYISSFVAIDSSKFKIPIVTSGKDGVFPPGIPVGRIIQQEKDSSGSLSLGSEGYKSAYIQPLVNLESLDSVVVIKKKPYGWASNWPENKNIFAVAPKFEGTVEPDQTNKELPGTLKVNIPKFLVDSAKKEEETKSKKKPKTKTKKVVKKKQPSSSVTDEEDEFGDIYIEDPNAGGEN